MLVSIKRTFVTKRFLEAVAMIIENGEARSEYEIAQKIKSSHSAISEIRRGKTNAGMKLLQKFVNVYQNYGWVLAGEKSAHGSIKENIDKERQYAPISHKEIISDLLLLKRRVDLLQQEYDLLRKEIEFNSMEQKQTSHKSKQ